MVRFLATVCALTLAANASAFAPASGFARSSTELSAAATTVQEVKKTINNMNKENFSASIAEIEPFLLNDAGITVYTKAMKKVKGAAKALGIELSADYAKASKSTETRRGKQDAFIQKKEAERVEAEEAAAAAVIEAAEAAAAAEVAAAAAAVEAAAAAEAAAAEAAAAPEEVVAEEVVAEASE